MQNGKHLGEILHAKHAFMPNSLGYCGPDDRGKILDHLHRNSTSEKLLSILKDFDAAYPFVRMIASSTGKRPFDYDVAEAYWLGNSLLESVPPVHFYEFTHRYLGGRIQKGMAKPIFKEFGQKIRPHHTFYVLGLYSRVSPLSDNNQKLLQLMDSCRISWGKVQQVEDDQLLVEKTPLIFVKDRLKMAPRRIKTKVAYDSEIPAFNNVRIGDWVSLHWNFASEKLAQSQLQNLRKYTQQDISVVNSFADRIKGLER
ncbi:MAG TPA: DUF6390 family protein [Nitrososphaerales archaeon]|nr:DUF6390 family protein [Nitrososphaerales archaeon]